MAVTYATKGYVIGRSNILSVEESDRYSDAETVIGLAEIGATDWHQVKDSATIQGLRAFIGTVEEFEKAAQAGTVTGTAELFSVDQFAAVDLGTVLGIATLLTYEERGTSAEGSIVSSSPVVSAEDILAAVDASTVISDGSVNSVISHTAEYNDSSTVVGRHWVTERDDDAAFIDASTVTGTNIVSAVDKHSHAADYEIIGIGIPSSIGETSFADTETVIGMGVIGNTFDDEGTVIGSSLVETTLENYEYLGTYTVINAPAIDTEEDYQRTIEDSIVIGTAVILFEEGTIGNNIETLVNAPLIIGVEAYTAIRGTGNDKGGVATLVGSSTDFGTYSRTGSGKTGATAAGSASSTVEGSVPGYVSGGSITGITTATPMVVTLTAHGFVDNQGVSIQDVIGLTDANDLWRVGSATANTFALLNADASNSTTAQTYTSGGNAYNGVVGIQTISAATTASPIEVTTATAHGYLTGRVVKINGALGLAGLNGIFAVTVINTTSFTLDGSTGAGTYTADSAHVVTPSGAVYTTTTTQFPQLPLYQRYNA